MIVNARILCLSAVMVSMAVQVTAVPLGVASPGLALPKCPEATNYGFLIFARLRNPCKYLCQGYPIRFEAEDNGTPCSTKKNLHLNQLQLPRQSRHLLLHRSLHQKNKHLPLPLKKLHLLLPLKKLHQLKNLPLHLPKSSPPPNPLHLSKRPHKNLRREHLKKPLKSPTPSNLLKRLTLNSLMPHNPLLKRLSPKSLLLRNPPLKKKPLKKPL
ncbi:hypothetical protein MRX96_019694 [Rhipicephalus microplus]